MKKVSTNTSENTKSKNPKNAAVAKETITTKIVIINAIFLDGHLT